MEFITIRDLRNYPKKVQEKLKDKDILTLTSNGKPVAILTSINSNNFEEELFLLKKLKAQIAVNNIRQKSYENGKYKLTMEEIEKEIKKVRKKR